MKFRIYGTKRRHEVAAWTTREIQYPTNRVIEADTEQKARRLAKFTYGYDVITKVVKQ